MTAVVNEPLGPPAAPPDAFGPTSTISADLIPDEIRVKRRVAFLKRRLVFVVAALVALLVLGDALVREQTSSAASDLASANDRVATLTKQSNGFGALLSTQGETQAIRTQLTGAMADDVSWTALIDRLAAPAPRGLTLGSVSAQLSASTTTAVTNTAPVTSTDPTIGTMTLTGTAPSWSAVAEYVNAVATIKGITAVNPSTVSSTPASTGAHSHGMAFTITLSLTSAVLSNRYAPAPAPHSAAVAGKGSATGSNETQTAGGGTAIPAQPAATHSAAPHPTRPTAARKPPAAKPAAGAKKPAAAAKRHPPARHQTSHSRTRRTSRAGSGTQEAN